MKRSPASTTPLIVVGASARAAAASAALAGFHPWAYDQFADADLAALGTARALANFPSDLASLFHESPPAPWIFTGGLENHPDLVERLAAIRPLLGTSAETLRQVRNPAHLAETLAAAKLPVLAVRSGTQPPEDGIWFRKPLRSGGGLACRRFECRCETVLSAPSDYFQQAAPESARIVGAVFLMAGGQSRLLGASALYSGAWPEPSCDGVHQSDEPHEPYLYRGSATCRLASRERDAVRRVGEALARAYSLAGVVGVDFAVLDHNAWVLEVNPRYPASAELIDLQASPSVVALHLEACASGAFPAERGETDDPPAFAKWIVYSRQDCECTAARARWLATRAGQHLAPRQWLADLPTEGTRIPSETPLCTFLTPIDEPPSSQFADQSLARQLARQERQLWEEWLAVS